MKPPPRHHAVRHDSGRRRLVRAGLAGAAVVLLALLVTARWFGGRAGPAVPPALSNLEAAHPELRARLQAAHQAALRPDASSDDLVPLARLLHANGFVVEADACWQALMQAQPRAAPWPYFRADLRRLDGDTATMEALLERTVQLDRDYAPAWLQLAEHRFKTSALSPARAAYERRLALEPGDPYARLGLARLALQEGRSDEARRLVGSLVADAPNFPPARNLHAELLAAAGEPAAAERERLRGSQAGRFRAAADPWLEGLLEDCFDYERLCVSALTEILTGRIEIGEARLERARALRPEAFPAYELLGNVYLDRGDARRALELYAQGRAAAPEARPSTAFFVNLARAHRTLGQPAQAVQVLREGLAGVPRSAELLDALGLALAELPDAAAALAAHQRAVELNPENADATYHYALALIGAQRLDEAVAELQRLHALNPSHPATLSLLGQIEMDSGRWQQALQYLRPLFEAQPELPEARAKMVLVLRRAGEEAELAQTSAMAEAHYRAGLQIQSDHPDLLARLGLLLLQEKRAADAIVPLEAYHRLQPPRAHATLLLARAYATSGRSADARRVLQQGLLVAESTGDQATLERLHELLRRLP